MYNKNVLEELLREFGFEKTLMYCRMESRKNELLEQEDKSPSEYEFEKEWWKQQHNNLKNLKKDEFAAINEG